ncbi:hypothetical protein P7C73_g5427, partial [Tremellales sp. Uapishka_1]
MWLFTAVGAVHGQSKFTFALEHGRSYVFGRDKDCDIRLESKKVRPREGVLVVEDWDPTQRTVAPLLKVKIENKKSGGATSFRVLLPKHTDEMGTTEKDDYDSPETQGGTILVHGQGVELAEDGWFVVVWKDLHLLYEGMAKEEEPVRETLHKYCISYTASFDDHVNRPNYVLSSAYKPSPDTNFAVCYAIRILLPAYLEALRNRFIACWKKVADSGDSFTLPDETAASLQPQLAAQLPNMRNHVQCWLPDERRPVMFKGWQIMGLRGRNVPAEKRYLEAMGATYVEKNVIDKPLLSSQDFQQRIQEWLDEVERDGVKERAVVVHFSKVKDDLTKKGVNFGSVVEATCQRLGVVCSSGAICWGSVLKGGIEEYFNVSSKLIPETTVTAPTPAKPIPPPTSLPAPPESIANAVASSSKSALPTKSISPPTQPTQNTQLFPSQPQSSIVHAERPDVVPSTYPDETDGINFKMSPAKRISPEPSLAPKKPLKRRAGRVREAFLDEDMFGNQDTPIEVDPPASAKPESMLHSSARVNSVEDSFPSMLPSRSRLKRRAGGATQASMMDFDHLESSVTSLADRKKEETNAEAQELYQQLRAGIEPAPKRARLETGESSRRETPSRDVEIDMDNDEEDFVHRTLRKKKPVLEVPPPGQRSRSTPIEEAAEEDEPVEPVEAVESAVTRPPVPTPKPKKDVPKDPKAGVSKDEAFLQAISKHTKGKKALDQFDKEFNKLRIAKPGVHGKGQLRNAWEVQGDNYDLVRDFEDDLTGNFITIVRKDLLRKDLGKDREAQTIDDGRPNFKKFKKKNIVRKEPVHVVLAAPVHEAEMGEAYWPGDSSRHRVTQDRRPQTMNIDDENELPLLPPAKKRVLKKTADNDDDDDLMPPPTAPAKRRAPAVRLTPVATTQRKTRAASVVSNASSQGTTASVPRGRKAKAVEPIVLEDSDEDVDQELAASSSRSRGTKTLDDDGPSTGSGRSRRKMVMADDGDDDVMVFKGIQKKRRLG